LCRIPESTIVSPVHVESECIYFSSTYFDVTESLWADIDRCSARSVTETIIHTGPTGRELVATARASPAIAEPNIVRGTKALGVRSIEALCAASVHSAVTSADVDGPAVTVDDSGDK
jgi:hypothetical protein